MSDQTESVELVSKIGNGQQKIQPLTKNELLYGGVSMIIIMSLALIFETYATATFNLDSNGIFTEQDLINYHDTLSKKGFSTAYLLQCAMQVIVTPLYILYYIAVIRVFKICFPMYYVLREMFAITFIGAVIILYASVMLDVAVFAFEYSIRNNDGDIITSIYFLQLTLVRISTLGTTYAVYFGMVSQNALWIAILKGSGLDKNYNGQLKEYILPSICHGILSTIILIFLLCLNALGPMIAMFS